MQRSSAALHCEHPVTFYCTFTGRGSRSGTRNEYSYPLTLLVHHNCSLLLLIVVEGVVKSASLLFISPCKCSRDVGAQTYLTSPQQPPTNPPPAAETKRGATPDTEHAQWHGRAAVGFVSPPAGTEPRQSRAPGPLLLLFLPLNLCLLPVHPPLQVTSCGPIAMCVTWSAMHSLASVPRRVRRR